MYYLNGPVVTSLIIAIAAIVHAVPSPRSSLASSLNLSPTPTNLTSPSHDEIYCFVPGDREAHTITPSLCPLAIDSIISRDGPKAFSERQPFYCGPDGPPGTHEVPDDWLVDTGAESCQVLLGNSIIGARDVFSLKDVAVIAQQILIKCAGTQKKDTLGGVKTIGNGRGFIVAVNGKTEVGQGIATTIKGIAGSVTS